MAIEDSNTGAKSAEAAGCTVLVVENHVPVLDGPRRVFRDSLVGLTVDELRGLVRDRWLRCEGALRLSLEAPAGAER